MAFNGNESEEITLAEAITWTTAYRQNNPNQVKAHFFGKNKINDLLDQDDCMGFRAYYAIDDNNKKQLVLVGVDADGVDLTGGIILERSTPCPDVCDEGSALY